MILEALGNFRRALEGSKGEGAPRGLLEAPRFRVLQRGSGPPGEPKEQFSLTKVAFEESSLLWWEKLVFQ